MYLEFAEARQWVAESLTFDLKKYVNLFEMTIRALGGLLSAFHLSGDKIFAEKAKDLGERLIGAFDTPSRIPYSDVNLQSRKGRVPQWSPDSSLSEVTTLQLEFRAQILQIISCLNLPPSITHTIHLTSSTFIYPHPYYSTNSIYFLSTPPHAHF